MKRNKASHSTGNYWPGYVDAMTNVVLNLLFMVAMFGITLTVFNSIPRAKAGQTGTLPYIPTGATTELSKAKAQNGRVANLISTGERPSAEGREAGRKPIFITIADSYRRDGGPDVQLVQNISAGGGVSYILDLPHGADPSQSLTRPQFIAALRRALPNDRVGIAIWAMAPVTDPIEQRTAYLALMTLRNSLIVSGWASDRITVRIANTSVDTRRKLRLFITKGDVSAMGERERILSNVSN